MRIFILCVAAALIIVPPASPTSPAPPPSRLGAFHACHTCLASPPPGAGNDRSTALSRIEHSPKLRLRGGSGAPGEDQPSADHDADTSEEEMAEVEASPTEGEVPDNAPASCPGTASDQAGKTDGCEGCPNQKACSSGEGAPVDPDAEAIAARMAGIKYKVLVLSGKGGVGKSTVASQLALALSDGGSDTGLLDIDICGPSAPRMLGVEAEEVRQAGTGWQPVWVGDRLCVMSIGFMLPTKSDAVVWRGVRKNGLVKQFLRDVEWGDLDYLVVDAPPGTSDEHITLAQSVKEASNVAAVIVTTPQEVSLLDVRKEMSFCAKAGIPVLGVVENMAAFVCPNCNHASEIFPPAPSAPGAPPGVSGGEAMALEGGVPFLGRVPMDVALSRACEEGRLVDPASASGRELQGVAAKIREQLRVRFPEAATP